MLSAYSYPYLPAGRPNQMNQISDKIQQTESSPPMDEFSLFMTGEANSVVIPLEDDDNICETFAPELPTSVPSVSIFQDLMENSRHTNHDSFQTFQQSINFNELCSTAPVVPSVPLSHDQISTTSLVTSSQEKFVHRVSLPMGVDDSDNSVSSTTTSLSERSAGHRSVKLAPDGMLQKILKSHNEGGSADEDGFLPIHLACRHFPDNAELIGMILRSNPNTAMDTVSCPAKDTDGPKRKCDASSCDSPERPTKKTRTLSGSSFEFCPSSRIGGVRSESETYNYNGAYPLHIALKNRASIEVIRLLACHAPDALTKGDAMGSVPLSLALKVNASADIVNLLLSINSSAANVPDYRLNFSLHIACMSPFRRHTSRRTAYCLQTLGALVSAFPAAAHSCNFNGKTPLELAQNGNHFDDDAISLLQENAFKEDECDVQEIPWL